jgi:hypothetical protein
MPLPPAKPPQLAVPDPQQFLALSADPGRVDPAKDDRFYFDAAEGRYHDKVTHMALTDGKWYFDPNDAGAAGNPFGIVSYDPAARTLYGKNGTSVQINPQDATEYFRWLMANGGSPS